LLKDRLHIIFLKVVVEEAGVVYSDDINTLLKSIMLLAY